MGGQSGSWTPTKRRGPIAAEFQGPGPAALVLPSLFGSKLNLIEYGTLHSKKYDVIQTILFLVSFVHPRRETGL